MSGWRAWMAATPAANCAFTPAVDTRGFTRTSIRISVAAGWKEGLCGQPPRMVETAPHGVQRPEVLALLNSSSHASNSGMMRAASRIVFLCSGTSWGRPA